MTPAKFNPHPWRICGKRGDTFAMTARHAAAVEAAIRNAPWVAKHAMLVPG